MSVRLIAKNGDMDCLKFAHENGCGIEVCYTAAQHDNLECLKYAYKNNSPWDDNTSSLTAHSGSLDCFKYMINDHE